MRIRLHVPFFFQNHRYDVGDIVDLPDGVKGPYRTRTVRHDRIDYGTDPSIDANRLLAEVADEPAYDVLDNDPPAAQSEQG